MSNKYRLFLFSLCVIILSGCLKDDRENCETPVTLTYMYEYHNHNANLLEEEVFHIHLYIYDQNGDLVREGNIARNRMYKGNSIQLNLPPGDNYTAISWGNIHTEHFICHNKEKLESMQLSINCIDEEGNLIYTEPGSLFYGKTTFDVKPDKPVNQSVSLIKNSSYINLRIKGIKDPDLVLYTYIVGDNGYYYYDNTIHSNTSPVAYISEQEKTQNYYNEKLQIYRLFPENEEIKLFITTQKPDSRSRVHYFEEPLVPILLENVKAEDKQEYLDKADEHSLIVTCYDDGKVVVAVVASWEDEDNDVEI